MLLPDGRVSLESEEFSIILDAVGQFHDAFIGCATFWDPSEQTIFIEEMYFGTEYQSNPIPIIGGMFSFDLPVSDELRNLENFYGREVGRVSLSKATRTIEFSLQDQPFEKFRVEFGALANFQFVTSSALSDTPLQRR